MSDENVVPFPRPPLPAEKGVLRFGEGKPRDGELMTRCEGNIHIYAATPGRCQCGENFWDGSTDTPAAGGSSA